MHEACNEVAIQLGIARFFFLLDITKLAIRRAVGFFWSFEQRTWGYFHRFSLKSKFHRNEKRARFVHRGKSEVEVALETPDTFRRPKGYLLIRGNSRGFFGRMDLQDFRTPAERDSREKNNPIGSKNVI